MPTFRSLAFASRSFKLYSFVLLLFCVCLGGLKLFSVRASEAAGQAGQAGLAGKSSSDGIWQDAVAQGNGKVRAAIPAARAPCGLTVMRWGAH